MGRLVDEVNRVAVILWRLVLWGDADLLGGCDPTGVGVEKEEENHAESHKVHVDAKDDASVIEAPAALHAADGVSCAGDCEEGGEDEEGGSVVVGEVGEEKSDGETEENQEAAAE